MRIGVSLAEQAGPEAFSRLRDDLKRAADDGFASAWMSNIFGLDALTALAVAGSQVPGIDLGTAVVPTYPRHPAVLAQQALTTAAAVGGRLLLGIGLSHKIVIEDMYGYSFDRPARHMREYLSILLPLLDGEPASFQGETMRAGIGLSTPRPGRVPVLLAALAPQMLRLAGAVADGTITWMVGLKTLGSHIVPSITAAAEKASKPEPRVVCALPVAVCDDVEDARERAAKGFAIYDTLPSYKAMLDREGAQGPRDVAVVGDESSVAEQIEAFIAQGATEFVAVVFHERDRTKQLLAKLASG